MTFVKKNFTTLCNRNTNIHYRYSSTKKLSIIPYLYKFKQVSKQESGLKASTFFYFIAPIDRSENENGPKHKEKEPETSKIARTNCDGKHKEYTTCARQVRSAVTLFNASDVRLSFHRNVCNPLSFHAFCFLFLSV